MSSPPKEISAPPAEVAPAPETPAKTPEPVVTDFVWAKAQMQQGKQVKRAGWQGKTVFLSTSNNEVMRLPQGFPTYGVVVPWLYEPDDTDATDWEIA